MAKKKKAKETKTARMIRKALKTLCENLEMPDDDEYPRGNDLTFEFVDLHTIRPAVKIRGVMRLVIYE